MDIEPLFAAALQSSFILGLIHGVNPCGHSWLVLAPFVTAEKKGWRVAKLTVAFLAGTTLACLLLGATLGAVSTILPPATGYWVEIITSVILIVLGALLIYDPGILHNHSHDHDHDCGCQGDVHHHHHHDDQPGRKLFFGKGKWLATSLFGIGFVNMIVPCPTAAVMYGYAINSGSSSAATLVFGAYAVSTALAVGTVIYLIFKATEIAGRMQKDWVEPLIMRSAGVIIVLFSLYGLYAASAGR